MASIYVSPSLQPNNIGVGGYGTEQDVMHRIGNVVVELLQFNHIEVYSNRIGMTLAEAVQDSNSKNVDAHLALHSDAGGGKGTTGFYKSENGKKLCEAVYNQVAPVTPSSDRGIRHTDSLYELNKTNAYAALVEIAFHDNPEDAEFITSHINEIAEYIAHGVCNYFNVEFKKPEQASEQGKLYRVQVGAFANKSNAERLAAELKAKGYSAIIV
jgi:N-acetylmuramoyl-L-alanine amidase